MFPAANIYYFIYIYIIYIYIFYLKEVQNFPNTKWEMKVLESIQKVLVSTELKKKGIRLGIRTIRKGIP